MNKLMIIAALVGLLSGCGKADSSQTANQTMKSEDISQSACDEIRAHKAGDTVLAVEMIDASTYLFFDSSVRVMSPQGLETTVTGDTVYDAKYCSLRFVDGKIDSVINENYTAPHGSW